MAKKNFTGGILRRFDFIRYFSGLGVLFLSMAALASSAEPGKEEVILAVFDIEISADLLNEGAREGLNNLLPTLMVENGWLVVPREQMKERLTEMKKESYRTCYDEKCQIELGRELAAQKALSSSIKKIGSTCQVSLQILDLKKAVLEKVARISSECQEEQLLDALRKAAATIGRKPAYANAELPATLKIDSKPSGASVYLGKNLIGKTPLSQLTASGSQTVSLLMKGYEPLRQQFSVQGGEKQEVLFELKPVFPYNTWGHISFWSGLGIAALGGLAGAAAKIDGDDYKDGNYEYYSSSVRWTGVM